MFSDSDITPIYTFTAFLYFVIFYLSLSFLALMHFYHMFIACSLYSFRYVIFLYIYYFHAYILYHLLCSIFMYCYHVLLSCTVIMYCHHVLISYIMSDCIISCYRTYHHIAVLCFSYHIISFDMSYSNHLFYISCL